MSKPFSLCFSIFMIAFFVGALEAQNQVVATSNIPALQKDTSTARQLLEKAKVLTTAGSYKAAHEALQKARFLYAKHEVWEEAIQCVIRLSKLSDNFDSVDLKIRYSNLALSLAQQHLQKDHPVLASAYRQKAEALMMLDMLDSANYFLTLGIPILENHQTWTDLGWSEILLGVNYLNQYQLDSCQKYLGRVKMLLQNQTIPEEDRKDIYATLLELSGVLYHLQGDYDKAIENTQEALTIDLDRTEFSALDSFFIAEKFNNLGALYFAKGDYQRALDNFMQAIHGSENSSEDHTLLYNIGELLIKQEKYTEAIYYFEKSLFLSKERQDLMEVRIDAFNGLGIAFRGLKQYDIALSYCQQALNISVDYRKPMTLATIGSIYNLKKQSEKALEYLKLAVKKLKIDSANNSFFISKIYHLTGDAHALNQDTDIALKFYQKALIANHAIFTDSINLQTNPSLTGIYDPVYFLEAVHAKAKTQASFTDNSKYQEAALATYRLTVQWIDTLQASYSSEASQLDWSSEFKPIYEEAIEVAFRLYQKTQDTKYLNLAFIFSEKSKNAILLETLKSSEGKSLAGVPDSLVQKEKDLNLNIAFYEKSLQKAKEQKEAAKEKLYQQYLSKTRLALVALKEQLEQTYPKVHNWKYGGKTTNIADVQSRLLDEQTSFLEYFVGDSATFVFVITKHSAILLPLAPPVQVKNLVADFRKTLLDPASFKHNAKAAFTNYNQKAFSVYRHILERPLTGIPAGIQHLIIVPDGVLNAIPFEALTKDTEVKADFDFSILPYVLYDFQLHYAYSAGLLLKNKIRREQLPVNISCLAFAPPYQGTLQIAQSGSLELLRSSTGQLEGTANEIQQISHFIDGKFDFGATATERQFKASANQFGILHLAMHGVVDFDNSSFNHLKFSDLSQDNLEDNLLHHYEIANMDLQAQLVVLSACETGVGKYEKGEGVFSLARSFMYAGIPSVVMSLWKVSDASTSQLMPYFYESLMEGQSKDGALREAKLHFLKEANIEFRHPFYWSAFVVMGDAQELKREHSSWIWWGIVVLIMMVFGGFWRKSGV